MKTELISNDNLSYLKVQVEQFVQKDKVFYIGKIKASIFLNVYTVRPAQYDFQKHTDLANSFPDDIDYYKHLLNEDKINLVNKDFQRDPNKERIGHISQFLLREEYAFFPNTIIVNCELANDYSEYEINQDSSYEHYFNTAKSYQYLSFLKKENEEYYVIIPNLKNSILVIDGQHRLKGLEEASEEIKNSYDLIIAFIVGVDRSVVAKQFYTINYEQKPVNKSLLYQLTGEFSRDTDEISLLHNIVKLLNENEVSPFHGRIKMLGVTPKQFNEGQKKLLSISQAFLIDSMIRFVSEKAKNTLYPPIFLKYYLDTKEHVTIAKTISRFFNAVRKINSDWNSPESSILSKGMGVGALLKVFNLIFPIIFLNEMGGDWERIKYISTDRFIEILDGLNKVDFRSEGEFGKSGSAGSINKIKEAIIMNLSYLNNPNSYQAFEELYKTTYLPQFNAALSSIGNGS